MKKDNVAILYNPSVKKKTLIKSMSAVIGTVHGCNRRIHVMSRLEGGFAVKRAGGKRAIKLFKSAIKGFKFALQLPDVREIVVHKKDGSVDWWTQVFRAE